MTDLAARLDRAITEARNAIWRAIGEAVRVQFSDGERSIGHALDHYGALVAVRAQLEECANMRGPVRAAREHDLTAEAERLLSGEAG